MAAEALLKRILSCHHRRHRAGQAQPLPRPCTKSPVKALPQEPPASRAETWASAAPPGAPGGQAPSKAPARSWRHQSTPHTHSPSKQPSVLMAWRGDKTGEKARAEQRAKRKDCKNGAMEKAGAQPLGIPSLLLPLLCSVPQAPHALALQRDGPLEPAGPHPDHVHGGLDFGAPTEEPPVPTVTCWGQHEAPGEAAPLSQHGHGMEVLPVPTPCWLSHPAPPGLSSLTPSPGHTCCFF